MKNLKYLLYCIFLILNCISTNKKNDYDDYTYFDFTGFEFYVTGNELSENNNPFCELTYDFIFKFTNKNDFFKVNYILYDSNDNILSSMDSLLPQSTSIEDQYIINGNFKSSLCFNKIKYYISIEINDKKYEFNGEYINEKLPYIDNVDIGPIISRKINNKNSVLLNLSIILKNIDNIKWIRVIPPSIDFYWELPWDVDDNNILAEGSIYDKNKSFIQNGKYIIQINLGEYGVIQKEINIIDIFGNDTGANYGLPTALLLKENKNEIRLEINLKDKIDHMEIWLFKKTDIKSGRIGLVKYDKPVDFIIKKDFKNLIVDNEGKNIRLESNQDYYYKIYLYSNEYNNIKYISISDTYILKYKELKYFIF